MSVELIVALALVFVVALFVYVVEIVKDLDMKITVLAGIVMGDISPEMVKESRKEALKKMARRRAGLK